MEIENERIVIWCGSAPNQRALAAKLASRFPVAGIVIDEKKQSPAKRNLIGLPLILWDRFRFRSLYRSWTDLQKYYQEHFPGWPDIPVLRVAGINSPETVSFTTQLNPSLIIVSGTGLVKQDLLNLPVSKGIINLHTGLSPYVKGGPNCTNWCIANDDWHLVGNTIMWINAGIDSGNIITSEAVEIHTASSLLEAQKIVMEHAHNLYGRAVDYLLNTQAPYNAVPQEQLGKGQLFLTRMWTAARRKSLLKNWANRKKIRQLPVPATVPLPSN
jgi:Formyl transferase